MVVQDDPTYTDVGKGFIDQIGDPIRSAIRRRLGSEGRRQDRRPARRRRVPRWHRRSDGARADRRSASTRRSGTPICSRTSSGSARPVSVASTAGGGRAQAAGHVPVQLRHPARHRFQDGSRCRLRGQQHASQQPELGLQRATPPASDSFRESRDLTTAPTAANPTPALPDNFLRPIQGFGGHDDQRSGDHIALRLAAGFGEPPLRAGPRRFTSAYTWAGGTSNGWNQNNPLPSSVARSRNTSVQKHGRRVHLHVGLSRAAASWLRARSARQMLDDWQLPGRHDLHDRPGFGHQRRARRTISISRAVAKPAERSYRPAMRCCRAASADVEQLVQHLGLPASDRPGRHREQLQQRQVHPAGLQQPRPVVLQEVPICRARSTLEFRWETFNTFNHTQFSTIGTTAQLSATGQQTNGTFGKVTAARDGRKMMFGLKFIF